MQENEALISYDGRRKLYVAPERWVTYVDDDGDERYLLLPKGLPLARVLPMAKDDGHYLITGETGTGKDELAKLLWGRSLRHKKKDQKGKSLFRQFNCTKLSSERIVSDLFGHEAGSFTGATEKRDGLLVSLKGGTIVLDEIGELALHDQAKILEYMETKKVQAMGSDERPKVVDVRIIATTNISVDDPTEFRLDLLHRFGNRRIDLAPLRDRLDDIPFLIARFMDPYDYYTHISLRWLVSLMAYSWPGNIRQLYNYCKAVKGAALYYWQQGGSTGEHDTNAPEPEPTLTHDSHEHHLIPRDMHEADARRVWNEAGNCLRRLQLANDDLMSVAKEDPELTSTLKVLSCLLDGPQVTHENDMAIPFKWLIRNNANYRFVFGGEWRIMNLCDLLGELILLARKRGQASNPMDDAGSDDIPSPELINGIRDLPDWSWWLTPMTQPAPIQPRQPPAPTEKPRKGRRPGRNMSDEELVGHLRNVAYAGMSWSDLKVRLKVERKLICQTRDGLKRRITRIIDPAIRREAWDALRKIKGFPQ